MLTALRSRIVAMATIVSLAPLGAASAYEMVPDRDEVARQATLLVTGATLADICEMDSAGHGHDCPLCDKLPTAPRVAAPDDVRAAVLFVFVPLSADLVAGADDGLGPHAPRAPPAVA